MYAAKAVGRLSTTDAVGPPAATVAMAAPRRHRRRFVWTVVSVIPLALAGLPLAVASATPAAAASTGPAPTLVVVTAPNDANTPSGGNVVQTFDTTTNSALHSPVAVGNDPWSVAITPDGTTAYVGNNGSGTVTPVTVSTDSTGTALCLPSGSCPSTTSTEPEAVAVTPDGSAAYVANSADDTVSEILLTGSGAPKVANTPIGAATADPFTRPDAIAISPDGKTAWVANYASGTLVPIDLATGAKIGSPITIPVTGSERAEPTGLAFTPAGSHLLVADSGDGDVTDVTIGSTGQVTGTDTFALESTAPTGSVTPWAVAVTPAGSTAWVTDYVTTGQVVPVGLAGATANVVGRPVAVHNDPDAVAITPAGTHAYVANYLSDTVSVLSLSAGASTVTATIETTGSPQGLAVTPDQAPMASFTYTPAKAGSPTTFDAAASHTVPAGGALTYTWTFGDGAAVDTTTGDSVTHVYSVAGTYQVTLRVTDGLGTSTSVVYTGQTASRNGGAIAMVEHTVAIISATANALPEAIVADGGNASALPVSLSSGPPPSAAAGAAAKTGNSPEAVAITPAGKTAYVVDEASNEVTPVDMGDGQAAPPISSALFVEPDAIAIAPDGQYAYVVDGGGPDVVRITLATDAVSGIALDALPGNEHLDAIAIAPDGKTAYVVDGPDNTVVPIDLVTDTVEAPVGGSVGVGPDAIAVAPDGKTAYVVDGGSSTTPGGVTPIALTGPTPQPEATTAIGTASDHPDAIAVAPDGKTAYVVDAPGNGTAATVTVVDLAVTPVTTPQLGVSFVETGSTYTASALEGAGVTPAGTALELVGAAATGSGSTRVTEDVVVPVSISGTPSVGTPLVTPSASAPDAIAISPDQAPVASLALSTKPPIAAGVTETFDAAGSSNPSSPIADYTFDFGNTAAPTTSTKDSVTYAYPVAGAYTASVTVTDAAGTATPSTSLFTGQTASRTGGASAKATQSVVVYPTVAGVEDLTSQTGAGSAKGGTATGTTGQKVTITGTGFSATAGDTVFDFGTGDPATGVTCASTTSCAATVPATSASASARAVQVTAVVDVAGKESSPANPPADDFDYAGPLVTGVEDTTTGTGAGSAKGGAATGAASDAVTVTGSGFSTTAGDTTFDYGTGNTATGVTCSSATSCDMAVPTGPLGTTVDVTATVSGLTSGPNPPADQFRYLGVPRPVVTKVAPARGLTGTVVTISGKNLGDASAVDFGTVAATRVTGDSATQITAVAPTGPIGMVTVTVTTAGGTSGTSAADRFTYVTVEGYRMVAKDGGVFAFGSASYRGSLPGLGVSVDDIVGSASTPTGQGYWLVGSDGGVFAFGTARFHGSMGGKPLNKPVVDMAADPVTGGYWLVASDGGIFSFDAPFYGSMGGKPLNKPIVDMAAMPTGGGYWLVASDGGIFSFGNAKFYGSQPGMPGSSLNGAPVVAMAITPDGNGYWEVTSTGDVYSFGAAVFEGSMGSRRLNKPVVGMSATPDGLGYWLVASDGGVFSFGDAPFYGSTGNIVLAEPVVSIETVVTPDGFDTAA